MLTDKNQLYLAQIQRNDNETGSVSLQVQLLTVSTEEIVSDANVVGAANPSESSEQCFNDLNKLIGDRNKFIEILKATVGRKLRKDRDSDIKMLTAGNAVAQMAAFDLIQINVNNVISLSKLRNRIDSIKRLISAMFELPSTRLKRNATTAETTVENQVNVKHLWIRNSTFERKYNT